MPFAKGKSGNISGRPKGAKDKITPEVQRFAKSILELPAYRQRVQKQAIEGTLHPKMESLLWMYAYGAPKTERDLQAGITVNLGFIALPEAAEPRQLTISNPIELKALPEETDH